MLNTYSSCNSSYVDDLKVSNTDYDNVVVNHNNEQHLVWARDRNISSNIRFYSRYYNKTMYYEPIYCEFEGVSEKCLLNVKYGDFSSWEGELSGMFYTFQNPAYYNTSKKKIIFKLNKTYPMKLNLKATIEPKAYLTIDFSSVGEGGAETVELIPAFVICRYGTSSGTIIKQKLEINIEIPAFTSEIESIIDDNNRDDIRLSYSCNGRFDDEYNSSNLDLNFDNKRTNKPISIYDFLPNFDKNVYSEDEYGNYGIAGTKSFLGWGGGHYNRGKIFRSDREESKLEQYIDVSYEIYSDNGFLQDGIVRHNVMDDVILYDKNEAPEYNYTSYLGPIIQTN